MMSAVSAAEAKAEANAEELAAAQEREAVAMDQEGDHLKGLREAQGDRKVGKGAVLAQIPQ